MGLGENIGSDFYVVVEALQMHLVLTSDSAPLQGTCQLLDTAMSLVPTHPNASVPMMT